MFIDIHCHIDMYPFTKIKDIINRAKDAGVKVILNAGIDVTSNRKSLELAKTYKEVRASLGIYPVDAVKMPDKEIDDEIEFIRENKEKVVAIGEIGLDLKEDSNLEKQKEIFRRFISLALEIDRPIIVHSRRAETEAVEMLEKMNARKVIMHCFNGKFSLVKRIVKNGWLLSIPGIVTFSENFQKIVKEAAIENLLCETDSPFLHPVIGERDNEPANVIENYKKIAELKGISLTECEKKIEENFNRIFQSNK